MSREKFACPKCGASGVFEVSAVEQDERSNDVPVSTAWCQECNVAMERATEPRGIPVEFSRNRIPGTGGLLFVHNASNLLLCKEEALDLGIKLPEPGKSVKGRLIFVEDEV